MRKHLFFQYTLKGIYRFFISKSERTFLRLSLIYGGKKRYYKTKIKFWGYKFVVPDTRSFLWQFKEIFVEEYYHFENKVSNPIIFDCGANVGTSCAFFKYRYPQSKILAFEANPKISKYLDKNIRENSLLDINIIKKAVWINNQGLELGMEEADGSSMNLDKNKIKVESVRLKDYLEVEKSIDMLKMDIEGAEVDVLYDCKDSLAKVKNIFVEFHSYKNKSQELSKIVKILENAGFRYFIMQSENRSKPFINRFNKSNPQIDLQLNIFAYKAD